MREDGFNAGIRRIGTFALWTIPLTLGVAATLWLGVYIQAHYFLMDVSLEKRMAIYTGADKPQKSPVRLEPSGNGCIVITQMEFDGRSLVAYAKNECQGEAFAGSRYFRWEELSPNGSILKRDWDVRCSAPRLYGDVSECHFDSYWFHPSPRTAKIRVWVE